jgi:undecaprenyl-diphosphatase
MLQLICWAIFFALQPSARIHLKKIGPWLALGVFALCTLPVLIWNAQHGWITVTHVAGDAGLQSQWRPTLNYFFEFTGAEFGLLNPIFFIGALCAAVTAWKQRREKPLWLFLFCMSVPLFLGHWLYSFHSRVQPNWIAAAVPPLFCLMAAVWSGRKIYLKPWLATGILLGLVAAAVMLDSDLLGKLVGSKLPGDKDPSHRVRGWRETAQLVETEREKFDPSAFIIADHYGTTGLYSFYSPLAQRAAIAHAVLVYCLDSDVPINQFYFWDAYNYRALRRGQNALFVLRLDPYPLERGWFSKWLHHEPINYRESPPPRPAPERIAAEFETVTNLGVREINLRDGRIFQRVQIFGCYHLK